MHRNMSSHGVNGVMKKYILSNSFNLASAMMAAGDNKSLGRSVPAQGMPTRKSHHVLALWLVRDILRMEKGFMIHRNRRESSRWRRFYIEPYAVNAHPLSVESSKKGH